MVVGLKMVQTNRDPVVYRLTAVSPHPLEQEVEVDVADVAEAEDGRPVHVEGPARVELVQDKVRERREGGPLGARLPQRHVGPPLVLTVGGAELGDHLPTQFLVVGTLEWNQGVHTGWLGLLCILAFCCVPGSE